LIIFGEWIIECKSRSRKTNLEINLGNPELLWTREQVVKIEENE
jgi:hypothetical protein